MKIALTGLLPEEIAEFLPALPAFRSDQIFSAIRAGAESFDSVTTLPAALRRELAERFTLRALCETARLTDIDGTVKIVLKANDGAAVEAVLLEDGAGRKTACLSSQTGCATGCVFCKTGRLGPGRNLCAAEIVEQFYALGGEAVISNIVFMGMGEPLLNIDALRRAIAVFARSGSFSPSRITISTCGIIKGIRELGENGPAARLAVSLPSCDEDLLGMLMPGIAGRPLGELKEALLYWRGLRAKRVTVETVLLGGINTGDKDARLLSDFVAGLEVIVNVIPWNETPGLLFRGKALRPPEKAETYRFMDALQRRGIKTELRRRKGGSVAGSCGQLGGSYASPETAFALT